MLRLLLVLLILVTVNSARAATLIPIIFYNYTSDPGNVFIGVDPQMTGPAISTDGNSVQWSPVVTGIQQVGLQIGADNAELCYLANGALVLNEALYTGDIISIIYGQPQFPSGLACGCYGSACSMG
jgi:hypothetical protein